MSLPAITDATLSLRPARKAGQQLESSAGSAHIVRLDLREAASRIKPSLAIGRFGSASSFVGLSSVPSKPPIVTPLTVAFSIP